MCVFFYTSISSDHGCRLFHSLRCSVRNRIPNAICLCACVRTNMYNNPIVFFSSFFLQLSVCYFLCHSFHISLSFFFVSFSFVCSSIHLYIVLIYVFGTVVVGCAISSLTWLSFIDAVRILATVDDSRWNESVPLIYTWIFWCSVNGIPALFFSRSSFINFNVALSSVAF